MYVLTVQCVPVTGCWEHCKFERKDCTWHHTDMEEYLYVLFIFGYPEF
jgi:hypothetical protein